MLELEHISLIKNNKKILDDINLNINNNKLIVITGPNGSGKSTLIKTIMGIEAVSSGNIYYKKNDITNTKINERSNLGFSYAFQTPITFNGLKVKDLFFAINEKCSFNDIKNALANVGLCAKDYIDRPFDDKLSGGEKKRIEIAEVFFKNGNINIFDEPEAGIDLWSFDILVELFKKNHNNITIIISHQEKILDIANEIYFMNNGTLKKSNKEEILNMKLGGKNYE